VPFALESVHLGEIKVIVPKVFGDHRGFFMESYRKDLFLTNSCKTTIPVR
jgi:dTDP-4-dehydrorhamnose 3,5-epimerase-like enzyme